MKPTGPSFFTFPATTPGRWAVGLAAASVPLLLLWSFLPGGAGLSFLCALAGGILGLITLLRKKERSWLVFLTLIPMLNVFVFLVAEFLFPH